MKSGWFGLIYSYVKSRYILYMYINNTTTQMYTCKHMQYRPAMGARENLVGKNPGSHEVVDDGNRQADSPR